MGETSAYIVLADQVEKHRNLYETFAEDPGCEFGGSGVVLGDDGLCPLPHFPYEAVCPLCGEENFDAINEASNDCAEFSDSFRVKCPSCAKSYGMKEINSGKANWRLARNFIFISDIEPDEWEEADLSAVIKKKLPGVVDVLIGWDT